MSYPMLYVLCPSKSAIRIPKPGTRPKGGSPQDKSPIYPLAAGLTLYALRSSFSAASNSSALPRLPQTLDLLVHKTVDLVNPQADSSLERGPRNNHADNGNHDRNPIDASDQLVHCGVAVELANFPCLWPPASPCRKTREICQFHCHSAMHQLV